MTDPTSKLIRRHRRRVPSSPKDLRSIGRLCMSAVSLLVRLGGRPHRVHYFLWLILHVARHVFSFTLKIIDKFEYNRSKVSVAAGGAFIHKNTTRADISWLGSLKAMITILIAIIFRWHSIGKPVIYLKNFSIEMYYHSQSGRMLWT